MREIMFMREVALSGPAVREITDPCIDLSTGLFLYDKSPPRSRRLSSHSPTPPRSKWSRADGSHLVN